MTESQHAAVLCFVAGMLWLLTERFPSRSARAGFWGTLAAVVTGVALANLARLYLN